MDEKVWLKAWEQAAEVLHRIKIKELQDFDYQAQWKTIDEMLQWSCEHAPIKEATGLIELQKFILKNKHKIRNT
jgi:hypothetical protein